MVCWRSSRINDQELMQRETEAVRAQLESTSLLAVLSTTHSAEQSARLPYNGILLPTALEMALSTSAACKKTLTL